MKIPATQTMLKFIIPAVLIYALLSIYDLKKEKEQGIALLEDLRIKAENLEKENERISEEIASAGDDKLIADIARKRFGLVMPDEIVFYGPSD